jgi:hypothetical protein
MELRRVATRQAAARQRAAVVAAELDLELAAAAYHSAKQRLAVLQGA